MFSQRGISLPELLVALLLSSFLTLLLVQHYLNIKKQYRHIQTALDKNLELQLVTDLLRNSMREAGFTPCSNINHLITVEPIQGLKALAAIKLEESSLQISRMSERFDNVLQVITPSSLLITSQYMLQAKQEILIADCYHAEVQTISEVIKQPSGQLIMLTRPLAFTYHLPIYAGEWLEEFFFIRTNSHHKNTLFYKRSHAEELTTFVQSLSVQTENNKGKTLVKVTLGLDKPQSLELETMVRAP